MLLWYMLGCALAARPAVRPEKPHVLVHITDPQLGMKNMYSTNPEDWTAEKSMLSALAKQAVGLTPDLVFVGGDMQNWWPNEKTPDRNKPSKEMSETDFEVLKSKNLARQQRRAVREALKSVSDAGIPVYYTPGNHDIGDNPDESTLAQYVRTSGDDPGWGPLFQQVWKRDGVLYLQFNSQIYWSTDASLEKYRQQQLSFLQQETENLQNIKQLVLLTHIPPFMDSIDEQEGWANWKSIYRKQILDLLARSKLPMLWVCGHFHNNVEKDSSYQGVPLRIRVSSAAGTTMQWDGKDELPPKEASEVASKDVLSAFAKNIGFANIPKRLRAQPDRSGLRVFKIWAERFEDKWFTLEDLKGVGTRLWLRN